LLFEVTDGCPGLQDRSNKSLGAMKGAALIQVVDVGAIGDVNGDGVDDILFGASDCSRKNLGSVRLFSGRDGTLIRRIDGTKMWFGACVARVGDLDNDGVEDFAVGSPLANNQKGEVIFYSGKTAKVLRTLTNPETSYPEEFFGWTILRAADYDRDGVNDILISAEHWSVRAFSGKDWNQLFVVRSLRQSQDSFGASLADMGDCDGDGYPDFAVGNAESIFMELGAVAIFSGKDGKLLRELRHASDGGVDLCAIDDIDGDGVRDLVLVFMPPKKSPILQIVSGKSGHLIQEIDVAKLREEGNALIQGRTPQNSK
jgi:FG-GAP-like repeat